MFDKSATPCKNCGHRQDDHSKHFPICFICKDNKKSSHCQFERIENLAFLEWVESQKGAKR